MKRIVLYSLFIACMALLLLCTVLQPTLYAQKVPAVQVQMPFGAMMGDNYRAVMIEKEWLVEDGRSVWIAKRTPGMFGEESYTAQLLRLTFQEEDETRASIARDLAFDAFIILPEYHKLLREYENVAILNPDVQYLSYY